MNITRQQRYEYRDLLIEKGVPEEIAVIASERLESAFSWRDFTARGMLCFGFEWASTDEGGSIWHGVASEAKEVCK